DKVVVHLDLRSWLLRRSAPAGPSSAFSARKRETWSAISTLFRSDIMKWVFPRMPISGRCTRRASPPWRLIASTQRRAIARRTRQLSWPRSVGGRRVVLVDTRRPRHAPADGEATLRLDR